MEQSQPSPSSGRFEFQNWPVYRESMEFAKLAHTFCLGLPKSGNQSLGDQLRRASQSVPLNIAEGSSRTTRKDKVNYVRVAKGSTFECAAISELAFKLGLLEKAQYTDFQNRLANIGRMLSGMIRYLEKADAS